MNTELIKKLSSRLGELVCRGSEMTQKEEREMNEVLKKLEELESEKSTGEAATNKH